MNEYEYEAFVVNEKWDDKFHEKWVLYVYLFTWSHKLVPGEKYQIPAPSYSMVIVLVAICVYALKLNTVIELH